MKSNRLDPRLRPWGAAALAVARAPTPSQTGAATVSASQPHLRAPS
jgi:hypothetical protein